MLTKLGHVTVLVRDQDEALRSYTEKLGMEKRDDQKAGDFRWLTVAPRGADTAIVLLRPGEAAEIARVGQGTTWVVETDDCRKEHAAMAARGVKFRDEPHEMPWGVSAVFEDLYGNPYNLL